MASMLTSSGFKSWSGKTKDHGISIFCFSAKHTQNQNNEWSDSSIIKIQLSNADIIKMYLVLTMI